MMCGFSKKICADATKKKKKRKKCKWKRYRRVKKITASLAYRRYRRLALRWRRRERKGKSVLIPFTSKMFFVPTGTRPFLLPVKVCPADNDGGNDTTTTADQSEYAPPGRINKNTHSRSKVPRNTEKTFIMDKTDTMLLFSNNYRSSESTDEMIPVNVSNRYSEVTNSTSDSAESSDAKQRCYISNSGTLCMSEDMYPIFVEWYNFLKQNKSNLKQNFQFFGRVKPVPDNDTESTDVSSTTTTTTFKTHTAYESGITVRTCDAQRYPSFVSYGLKTTKKHVAGQPDRKVSSADGKRTELRRSPSKTSTAICLAEVKDALRAADIGKLHDNERYKAFKKLVINFDKKLSPLAVKTVSRGDNACNPYAFKDVEVGTSEVHQKKRPEKVNQDNQVKPDTTNKSTDMDNNRMWMRTKPQPKLRSKSTEEKQKQILTEYFVTSKSTDRSRDLIKSTPSSRSYMKRTAISCKSTSDNIESLKTDEDPLMSRPQRSSIHSSRSTTAPKAEQSKQREATPKNLKSSRSYIDRFKQSETLKQREEEKKTKKVQHVREKTGSRKSSTTVCLRTLASSTSKEELNRKMKQVVSHANARDERMKKEDKQKRQYPERSRPAIPTSSTALLEKKMENCGEKVRMTRELKEKTKKEEKGTSERERKQEKKEPNWPKSKTQTFSVGDLKTISEIIRKKPMICKQEMENNKNVDNKHIAKEGEKSKKTEKLNQTNEHRRRRIFGDDAKKKAEETKKAVADSPTSSVLEKEKKRFVRRNFGLFKKGDNSSNNTSTDAAATQEKEPKKHKRKEGAPQKVEGKGKDKKRKKEKEKDQDKRWEKVEALEESRKKKIEPTGVMNTQTGPKAQPKDGKISRKEPEAATASASPNSSDIFGETSSQASQEVARLVSLITKVSNVDNITSEYIFQQIEKDWNYWERLLLLDKLTKRINKEESVLQKELLKYHSNVSQANVSPTTEQSPAGVIPIFYNTNIGNITDSEQNIVESIKSLNKPSDFLMPMTTASSQTDEEKERMKRQRSRSKSRPTLDATGEMGESDTEDTRQNSSVYSFVKKFLMCIKASNTPMEPKPEEKLPTNWETTSTIVCQSALSNLSTVPDYISTSTISTILAKTSSDESKAVKSAVAKKTTDKKVRLAAAIKEIKAKLATISKMIKLKSTLGLKRVKNNVTFRKYALQQRFDKDLHDTPSRSFKSEEKMSLTEMIELFSKLKRETDFWPDVSYMQYMPFQTTVQVYNAVYETIEKTGVMDPKDMYPNSRIYADRLFLAYKRHMALRAGLRQVEPGEKITPLIPMLDWKRRMRPPGVPPMYTNVGVRVKPDSSVLRMHLPDYPTCMNELGWLNDDVVDELHLDTPKFEKILKCLAGPRYHVGISPDELKFVTEKTEENFYDMLGEEEPEKVDDFMRISLGSLPSGIDSEQEEEEVEKKKRKRRRKRLAAAARLSEISIGSIASTISTPSEMSAKESEISTSLSSEFKIDLQELHDMEAQLDDMSRMQEPEIGMPPSLPEFASRPEFDSLPAFEPLPELQPPPLGEIQEEFQPVSSEDMGAIWPVRKRKVKKRGEAEEPEDLPEEPYESEILSSESEVDWDKLVKKKPRGMPEPPKPKEDEARKKEEDQKRKEERRRARAAAMEAGAAEALESTPEPSVEFIRAPSEKIDAEPSGESIKQPSKEPSATYGSRTPSVTWHQPEVVEIGSDKAEDAKGVDIGMRPARDAKEADIGMRPARDAKEADIGMRPARDAKEADIGMRPARDAKEADIGMRRARDAEEADIGMRPARDAKEADIGMRPARDAKEADIGMRPARDAKEADIGMRPARDAEEADIGMRPARDAKEAGIGMRPARDAEEADIGMRTARDAKEADIGMIPARDAKEADIGMRPARDAEEADIEMRTARDAKGADIGMRRVRDAKEADIGMRPARDEKEADIGMRRARDAKEADIGMRTARDEKEADIGMRTARDAKEADIGMRPARDAKEAYIGMRPARDAKEVDIGMRTARDAEEADIGMRPARDAKEADIGMRPARDAKEVDIGMRTARDAEEADIGMRPARDAKEADIGMRPARDAKEADIGMRTARDAEEADIGMRPARDAKEADIGMRPARDAKEADIGMRPARDAKEADIGMRPARDAKEADIGMRPARDAKEADIGMRPARDAKEADIGMRPARDAKEADIGMRTARDAEEVDIGVDLMRKPSIMKKPSDDGKEFEALGRIPSDVPHVGGVPFPRQLVDGISTEDKPLEIEEVSEIPAGYETTVPKPEPTRPEAQPEVVLVDLEETEEVDCECGNFKVTLKAAGKKEFLEHFKISYQKNRLELTAPSALRKALRCIGGSKSTQTGTTLAKKKKRELKKPRTRYCWSREEREANEQDAESDESDNARTHSKMILNEIIDTFSDEKGPATTVRGEVTPEPTDASKSLPKTSTSPTDTTTEDISQKPMTPKSSTSERKQIASRKKKRTQSSERLLAKLKERKEKAKKKKSTGEIRQKTPADSFEGCLKNLLRSLTSEERAKTKQRKKEERSKKIEKKRSTAQMQRNEWLRKKISAAKISIECDPDECERVRIGKLEREIMRREAEKKKGDAEKKLREEERKRKREEAKNKKKKGKPEKVADKVPGLLFGGRWRKEKKPSKAIKPVKVYKPPKSPRKDKSKQTKEIGTMKGHAPKRPAQKPAKLPRKSLSATLTPSGLQKTISQLRHLKKKPKEIELDDCCKRVKKTLKDNYRGNYCKRVCDLERELSDVKRSQASTVHMVNVPSSVAFFNPPRFKFLATKKSPPLPSKRKKRKKKRRPVTCRPSSSSSPRTTTTSTTSSDWDERRGRKWPSSRYYYQVQLLRNEQNYYKKIRGSLPSIRLMRRRQADASTEASHVDRTTMRPMVKAKKKEGIFKRDLEKMVVDVLPKVLHKAKMDAEVMKTGKRRQKLPIQNPTDHEMSCVRVPQSQESSTVVSEDVIHPEHDFAVTIAKDILLWIVDESTLAAEVQLDKSSESLKQHSDESFEDYTTSSCTTDERSLRDAASETVVKQRNAEMVTVERPPPPSIDKACSASQETPTSKKRVDMETMCPSSPIPEKAHVLTSEELRCIRGLLEAQIKQVSTAKTTSTPPFTFSQLVQRVHETTFPINTLPICIPAEIVDPIAPETIKTQSSEVLKITDFNEPVSMALFPTIMMTQEQNPTQLQTPTVVQSPTEADSQDTTKDVGRDIIPIDEPPKAPALIKSLPIPKATKSKDEKGKKRIPKLQKVSKPTPPKLFGQVSVKRIPSKAKDLNIVDSLELLEKSNYFEKNSPPKKPDDKKQSPPRAVEQTSKLKAEPKKQAATYYEIHKEVTKKKASEFKQELVLVEDSNSETTPGGKEVGCKMPVPQCSTEFLELLYKHKLLVKVLEDLKQSTPKDTPASPSPEASKDANRTEEIKTIKRENTKGDFEMALKQKEIDERKDTLKAGGQMASEAKRKDETPVAFSKEKTEERKKRRQRKEKKGMAPKLPNILKEEPAKREEALISSSLSHSRITFTTSDSGTEREKEIREALQKISKPKLTDIDDVSEYFDKTIFDTTSGGTSKTDIQRDKEVASRENEMRKRAPYGNVHQVNVLTTSYMEYGQAHKTLTKMKSASLETLHSSSISSIDSKHELLQLAGGLRYYLVGQDEVYKDMPVQVNDSNALGFKIEDDIYWDVYREDVFDNSIFEKGSTHSKFEQSCAVQISPKPKALEPQKEQNETIKKSEAVTGDLEAQRRRLERKLLKSKPNLTPEQQLRRKRKIQQLLKRLPKSENDPVPAGPRIIVLTSSDDVRKKTLEAYAMEEEPSANERKKKHKGKKEKKVRATKTFAQELFQEKVQEICDQVSLVIPETKPKRKPKRDETGRPSAEADERRELFEKKQKPSQPERIEKGRIKSGDDHIRKETSGRRKKESQKNVQQAEAVPARKTRTAKPKSKAQHPKSEFIVNYITPRSAQRVADVCGTSMADASGAKSMNASKFMKIMSKNEGTAPSTSQFDALDLENVEVFCSGAKPQFDSIPEHSAEGGSAQSITYHLKKDKSASFHRERPASKSDSKEISEILKLFSKLLKLMSGNK